MVDKAKVKEAKKGFFKKLFEKIEKMDKEIEQKSKTSSCCCQKNSSDKNSCCS